MAAISGHAKKGYREALLRVLGDGEWHPFAQVYALVEGTIAPEEATRETAKWKTAPEDLDERVRLGKESIMGKALVNLRVERMGFRNDRRTLKFRLRPERMLDKGESHSMAIIPFRALMAVPYLRESFMNALAGHNAEHTQGVTLNPAQEYWVRFALQEEPPQAKAYEEDTSGNA